MMHKNSKKSGMTLVELLIVMGLMAALATYALTAIDGLSDRSRVETTEYRMGQLKKAIVGDNLQTSRFISDMGRLPKVFSFYEGEEFIELVGDAGGFGVYSNQYGYTPQIGGLSFAQVTFIPDYGWKGPYITGLYEKIYDGFGNRFEIITTDNTDWHVPETEEGEIIAIRSLGRDNEEGAGLDWSDEDVTMVGFDEMVDCSLTIQVYVANRYMVDSPVWGSVNVSTPLTSGTAARSYMYGDIFLSEDGVFRCKSNITLTSPASSPASWDTSLPGAETVVSNTVNSVVWEYMGVNNHYMSELKAVLFEPDAYGSNLSIKTHVQTLSSGETSLTIENITPGIRKLMVFGALVSGLTSANAYSSGLQTIELKCGKNFFKVYLTEKLQ